MKKLQMNIILAMMVFSVIAQNEHLIGLTVKEAYGDEAKLDNCISVGTNFPNSPIGDSVSDAELVLDTSVISL